MEQKILSLKDDKMTTRGELVEYPAELIGGRNLLTNIIDNWERGSYTGGSLSDFSSNSRIRTDFVEVEPSTQYIISFNSDYDVWIPELDASKVGVAQTYAVYWDSGHIFTTTSETKYLHICFRIKGSSYSSTNPEYFVYPEDIVEIKPKLEKGTIATPWTPAPEDLGLSYPDWVTEFKPSISENGILAPELIEYPAELSGGRNYFSIVEFESNKTTYSYRYAYYYHLQLSPNAQYVATTNDENGSISRYSNIYLYSGIFSSTPSTASNGVYIGRPMVVTSDADGYVTLVVKHNLNGNDGGSDGLSYMKIKSGETWLLLEKGTIATDWSPAPEDIGLSYPNWVTEFKPSISENGILIGSFTENPNL